MASSGQIPEIFGAPSGLGISAVKRTVAVLRGSELAPKSGSGGGKSAVHFEPPHYANLILGFAGFANFITGFGGTAQHIDAADAVKLFREFQFYRRGSNHKSPYVSGTLGKVLEILIEGSHDPVNTTNSLIYPDIVLCLNPPEAQLHWIDRDPLQAVVERYGPPVGTEYTGGGGVTRITRVSRDILLLARKHWWDTVSLKENADSPAREPAR
jgi:hypothetical protein